MLSFSKVSIPLVKEFRTSFGVQKSRDAMIFIYWDSDVLAFSEAVTDDDPGYGYEDNFTVLHVVKDHLRDTFSPGMDTEKFNELSSKVRGHNMAKGALEMLLWDINAKREGKPLYKFIGKTKGYADVGISVGMSTIEDELNTIESSIKKGYKRIKVKIEKGYDIELLRAIRSKFGDIPLSADANQAYSRDDFETLKKIDEYNLLYLEQPLSMDDFRGHALLKKEIKTPICLDESIVSPRAAENAIESESVDIINIKPGRVGGFKNSLDIIETAKEHDVGVWIGGMLETGIGRSFNVSIASHSDVTMPGDTSPNSRYFKRDITTQTFEMKNGIVRPFEGVGIGVSIDYEYLKRMEVMGGKLIE